MFPSRPTTKDVKEYMTTHECGMLEAKRDVMKAWQRRTLRELKLNHEYGWSSVEALFPVLLDLLETIIDP